MTHAATSGPEGEGQGLMTTDDMRSGSVSPRPWYPHYFLREMFTVPIVASSTSPAY